MTGTSRSLLAASGALGLALVAVTWVALSVGPDGFHPEELGLLLGAAAPDDIRPAILLKLRLPRCLMAMLAGAGLSCSGLVMQALLRNPLAEPYILGVSGGAALGAIAGLVWCLALGASMTAAFAGGMLSLLLVLALARGRDTAFRGTLLLSGVMVNALCSALILFALSMVPGHEASRVLFWIMGNVPSPAPSALLLAAGVVGAGLLALFLLSQRLNLLAMGADCARSLGIDAGRTAILLLTITTTIVSAIVSQTGLLGFIGLVVPHALRKVLGADHRVLVPACALGGAAFMVLCDTLARVIPNTGELPVGVLTAMIGAPLFMFLLWRSPR
jgi:iron complex transport system permease protein